MNQEVKELISSLAKDMNLNQIDIERAYEAPFALQAIVMKYRCEREKQHFPSLRIPYFGIFHCPSWNKIRLQKKQDKKKNENI